MAQELIIALVNHRKLGRLLQVFLIEAQENYHQVVRMVRARDIDSLELTDDQRQLVMLAEKISDEEITKRFSRRLEPTNFINNLDPQFFKEHVNPFIDKQLYAMLLILMRGGTRLFVKEDKYSNLYAEDQIKVHADFLDCRMRFTRGEEGTFYRLQLYRNGEFYPLLFRKPQFLVMKPAAFLYQGELHVLEKLDSSKILPFLNKKDVHILPAHEEMYYQKFVKQSIAEYKVKASGFQLLQNEEKHQASLSLDRDLSGRLTFVPRFEYGEKVFRLNQKKEVDVELVVENNKFTFIRTKRDANWEKQCLKQYAQWGLVEKQGFFYPSEAQDLAADDADWALLDWLSSHEPLFASHGVKYCHLEEDHVQFSRLKGELDVQMVEKEDWFDVHVKVRFGKYEIPFVKLRSHIRKGIRQFELPNGEIALLPVEWFASYADLLEFGEFEEGRLRLKKHHYALLKKIELGIDEKMLARLQELELSTELTDVPSDLQASLRSYQHQGFSWMYRLYKEKLGACLADDMGLGKTLQTITLLQKLKQEKAKNEPVDLFSAPMVQLDLFTSMEAKREKSPEPKNQSASLIVMPTSLLYNWRKELEKFAPNLKLHTHYGAQRERYANFQHLLKNYDVILTSYGTVRNDVEQLKELHFFYLILDESQYIKNPDSKTYRAVAQLQAPNRLVLTGTPIENSLSDLWAQMNFINPGLLGNFNYFKRAFIAPIEKQQDEEKQTQLQLLIRPFIMRRTKMEVAKDLPPVSEQIRYCKMAKEQQSIYEQEKSAIRNELLRKIETDGMAQSSMQILQGLSRLRQLANHPKMIGIEQESGKFKVITESLSELIGEGHKVLIFSSFVKHLNLVKAYLEEEGVKHSMLTGATTHREEVIGEFQQEEENRVFLISLKAGGVGLNLTQADYVFIIDPWWNPAAEMQAISRAHRIGQEKKVMVYRFITEGSIEEKIASLQERKSDLADRFVNTNNPLQGINQTEVLQLFG